MKLKLNHVSGVPIYLRQILRPVNRSLQLNTYHPLPGHDKQPGRKCRRFTFSAVFSAGISHFCTFSKPDELYTHRIKLFSALCCGALIFTFVDYVYELGLLSKKKSYSHPFEEFLFVKPDGQTEELDRNSLNKWFLFCIDQESYQHVGKFDLQFLSDVAAILALDACSGAELVECEGRTIVVPKENSDSRFQFQSAVLTDKSSIDVNTEITSSISGNLVVLSGSLAMLSRVREDMMPGCHGNESHCHDNCYFLLDPSGDNVRIFTGGLSAEIVSKEISEIVSSQSQN